MKTLPVPTETLKAPQKKKQAAPSSSPAVKKVVEVPKIVEIPVADIFPHRLNPRPWSEFYQCHVSDAKVAELVQIIGANGYDYLEPIQVRSIGDTYQIIAGHHRYCALIAAGWKTAPCVVVGNIDDLEAALRLVTRQGKAIEPWDLAKHAYRLCDVEGVCNQTEYAKKTGMTASLISKQIIASRVNSKIGLEQKLSISACAAIARAPVTEWERLSTMALEKSLSVHEIERLVSPPPPEETAKPTEPAAPVVTNGGDAEIEPKPETTPLAPLKIRGLYAAVGHMTSLNRWKPVTLEDYDLVLFNYSTLREGLEEATERMVTVVKKTGRIIAIAEPRHCNQIINEMRDHDWLLEQQLVWLYGTTQPIAPDDVTWPNCYRMILVFNTFTSKPYFNGIEVASYYKCTAQDLFKFGTSPGGGISASIATILFKTYVPIASSILIPAAFEKDAIVAGQIMDMKMTWLEPIETIFEAINKELPQ
jgi:ParB-like chromosome segregation protein Spo0J